MGVSFANQVWNESTCFLCQSLLPSHPRGSPGKTLPASTHLQPCLVLGGGVAGAPRLVAPLGLVRACRNSPWCRRGKVSDAR